MPNYATKLFIYHNCLSPKPNFSFLLDCTSLCWVLCAFETQKQDAFMVVVYVILDVSNCMPGEDFYQTHLDNSNKKTFPCSPWLEHIYMSSVLTTPAAYFFMYPDFLSFKWKEERFKTLDIYLICFDWTEFDRYKHVMYKVCYVGQNADPFFFKKKSNRLRFSMFYFIHIHGYCSLYFSPFSCCKIGRVHVSFICT